MLIFQTFQETIFKISPLNESFDEPFKCALFESKPKIYMKINKQNHEQIKIKHNRLKGSSFFV